MLKRVWPGWVTGKLSDLAGLYLFPLVIVAVLEAVCATAGRARPRRGLSLGIAAAATVVVFASIKMVPPAGDVYRTVFGWIRWPLSALENGIAGDGFDATARVNLVADRSDLIALPAAGLAWLVHGRPPRTGRAPDQPSTS